MSANLTCSSAADEARRIVNELIRIESRGAGDTENAMKRLARRHGISWRTFWTLRYRRPADVYVSVFERLKAAYESECRRQLGKLQHEIEIAQIKGVSTDDIAASARALVARCESKEGGEG